MTIALRDFFLMGVLSVAIPYSTAHAAEYRCSWYASGISKTISQDFTVTGSFVSSGGWDDDYKVVFSDYRSVVAVNQYFDGDDEDYEFVVDMFALDKRTGDLRLYSMSVDSDVPEGEDPIAGNCIEKK